MIDIGFVVLFDGALVVVVVAVVVVEGEGVEVVAGRGCWGPSPQ